MLVQLHYSRIRYFATLYAAFHAIDSLLPRFMLDRLKMPSAYTPSQKGAIAQFVSFTSTKDSVAAKVPLSFSRSFTSKNPRSILFLCLERGKGHHWQERRLTCLPVPATEIAWLERRASCRCVCIHFRLSTSAFYLVFDTSQLWISGNSKEYTTSGNLGFPSSSPRDWTLTKPKRWRLALDVFSLPYPRRICCAGAEKKNITPKWRPTKREAQAVQSRVPV